MLPMTLPRAKRVRAACASALLAFAAAAQATVVIDIQGDVATADISLPTAGPTYHAQLVLTFDDPVGLSAQCLGISATALEGAALVAVNARLADAPNTALDPAFPVLVTVDPPTGCGLGFRNEVLVELHTEDLAYAAFSPYRLFKAPTGGTFVDITAATESGSFRARGTTGGFSEFVIAKRTVQDYAADATAIYDALHERLDDDDISPTTQRVLETDLNLSRAAFEAGATNDAITLLQAFRTRFDQLAGTEIPNEWRDERDLVDDAGEIASLTDALAFALSRLAGNP